MTAVGAIVTCVLVMTAWMVGYLIGRMDERRSALRTMDDMQGSYLAAIDKLSAMYADAFTQLLAVAKGARDEHVA